MIPIKLYKYILNRFVSTFAAALGIFTVLFLMDQASRQVEQLALQAESLKDFVISFLLLAPPLLNYTIPIAFLMAMIWVLEQMKQERELLAITSSGIAPLRLMTPFIAISLAAFAATYLVTSYIGPASLRQYYERLNQMALQSFVNDLKPGVLFKGIPGTLLLVGGFDSDSGRIDGLILIRNDLDETEKGEIVLAESGEIQPRSSGTEDLILKLRKGTLHPVFSAQDQYRSGSFETLVSRMRNQAAGAGIKTKDFLMAASNEQLKSWMTGKNAESDTRLHAMYAIEINRRITFPLTILLYPFVIFPVAVTTGRHGKAVAFTGSLLLFIANFILLSVGSRLAYDGMVPSEIGAWFPVIFLTMAGLAVFPAYTYNQLKKPPKTGVSAP